MKKLLLKGCLICLLMGLFTSSFAQINVSVQVLPPYRYRITDYASHPEQVMITVMNTSTTERRIQLLASIAGDNGVEIHSSLSFRSGSPIVVPAGGLVVLNAGDISSFLDFENLIYTGITKNEAIRGNGLPEANYRLCARAYDYDNNLPLSADQPNGCSNSFSITSLEPPTLISPYNEQIVLASGTQVLTLNWSTPPGAPPTVMYRLRLVEIVGNLNPNAAMQSASTPFFFEKEVMGNMYIYNPGDPILVAGRRYALMVQAFDPTNAITFRNNGQSAVIGFTYSVPIQYGTTPTIKTLPTATVATNVQVKIGGTVNWAFDATEATDETGGTPLVSTTPIIETSQEIVPSYKADRTQYPLKGAVVILYVPHLGSRLQSSPLGRAMTDAEGKYVMPPISSKQWEIVRNPYIEISSPEGFFNTITREIEVPKAGVVAMNVGLDVVTANTMQIAANVVRPTLTGADQVSVNILLNTATWNKYSFLKSVNASLEHTQYNGKDYVILTTLRSGNAYKKLFLGQDDIKYVAQVNVTNKPPVYYPIQQVRSLYAQKRIVSIKRNFAYNLNNTLDGTITFKNKGRSGVRITATLNPSDVSGPLPNQALETVTDFFGYYSFNLPDLKKGSVIKLSITDRTIQDIPFSEETIYNGTTPFTKNIVLKNIYQSVVGRLVDNNNFPVANAMVKVIGTNISTKTTAEGIYYLTTLAASSLALEFSADGYNSGNVTVNMGSQDGLKTSGLSPSEWQSKMAGKASLKDWMTLKKIQDLTADNLGIGSGNLFDVYSLLFIEQTDIQRVVDSGNNTISNLNGIVRLNIKLNGQAIKAKISINSTVNQDVPVGAPFQYSNTPGNYKFAITALPDDKPFVPFLGEFNLIKGGLNDINIQLQDGVRISGKIANKKTGIGLDSVVISVVGMPYTSSTDKSGQYVLYLPKNESFTYSFQRRGYYKLDSVAKITESSTFNVGLEIIDLSIPKITTLAGYPVVITKQLRTADANYSITGTLTVASNALFRIEGNTKTLTFKNVNVRMGAKTGNAEPIADINFEEAVLKTTMFGFAPVEVQGMPFLQLKANAQGNYSSGIIGGNQLVLKLNESSVVSKLPVKLNDAIIKDGANTNNIFNAVFSAPSTTVSELTTERSFKVKFLDANYDYSTIVSFLTTSSTPTSYVESKVGSISSLFIDRNLALLTKAGIDLNGYFQFPKTIAIDLADGGKIKLEKFLISSDFSLGLIKFPISVEKPLVANMQKVVLKLTKLELSGLGSANVGVTMGGSIALKKQDAAGKDDDGVLTIKTLSIINMRGEQTLSGSFNLPAKGLSIKSLVFTTPGNTSIDMSYSSADKSFNFAASGLLDYKKDGATSSNSSLTSIFPVEIQKFQLSTKDWAVFMAVKPNIKIDLKAVKISVDRFLVNIGYGMTMDKMNSYLVNTSAKTEVSTGPASTPFDEAQGSWAVGIAGGVEFPIKGFKANVAGSILVANTGNGIDVRLNEIALAIENPTFKLTSTIKIAYSGDRQGFEGIAKMTTLNKVFDANFKYYSLSKGGFELGAGIKATAGIITGPIQWHSIGGGFDFNTGTNIYSVYLTGDIGPTGTPKDVAYLKDTKISVLFDANNCGGTPVIEGRATLNMEKKDWGNMTMKVDFCKKLLLVTVDGNVPLMTGLGNVNVKGVLFGLGPQSTSSGALFLAVNANLSTLGDMLNGNAFIALGINYNNTDADSPAEARNMFGNINTSALENVQTGTKDVSMPVYKNVNLGFITIPMFMGFDIVKVPTYTPYFNAIYVKGSLNMPSKSGGFNVGISGFKAFGFNYGFGGSGKTEMYYKYNNKTLFATASISAYANASASIMGFSLYGNANANINITGGYDGSWYLNGNASLGFSLYNDNSVGCNSIRATWVECCCSTWHHPCCGNPFRSCCYDWSCTSSVCLGYPSVGFKVCKNLSASFAYRQNKGTQVNFNLL